MTKVPPLIEDDDPRKLIPLAEVAKRTGIDWQSLRYCAIDGSIPGARQIAKGKQIYFERRALNAWWQRFNEGRIAK